MPISRNTVLILGAGSNFDYGFPTGNDLTELICDPNQYKELHDLISDHPKHIERESLSKQLREIESHFFKSRNLSIDSWLSKNPQYGQI